MRLHVLVLSAALTACGGVPPGDVTDAPSEQPDASFDTPDASLDGVELPDAGPQEPDPFVDAGSVEPGGGEESSDAGTVEPGPVDGGTTGGGTTGGGTGGGTAPASALLHPQNPMPCADPAVVTDAGSGESYVFCTGMTHVWKTADWVHFSNVRSAMTFNLGGMSANGKQLGAWWAPGLVYAPGLRQYVMWVSVPDAQATNTAAAGWDTRSLAVLTASSPAGPWTFRAIALNAAVGEHYIDPFLFRDHDGGHYVYWKQYGGQVSSSIMGARVDASWTQLVAGSKVELMHGYGGAGTWEDNVRENPAVWFNAGTGRYHLLFSGGHWRDDTYATGHALSSCGPLCPPSSAGGWHIVSSGDRGVVQAVQAKGDRDFKSGGPGGAVFVGDSGQAIVYAAAARSASGDSTRYLMRDSLQWQNHAPFVDTAGHRPLGF